MIELTRHAHKQVRRCARFAAMLLGLTVLIAWGCMPVRADLGSPVPSFYVRAVTGPLAGKSVCYVCRNGDRPVVLVILREVGPETAALLKELDQVVDRRRAEGLRCFAVLLTGQPQRDLARLQTLAFDEKIGIPLTLAHESVLQGSTLETPQDMAITVFLYQDQRTIQQFGFKAGTCDPAARQTIVRGAERVGLPR